MRRLKLQEKFENYLPYAAVLALSLALGAILAGSNPDYTRALATWLTMTFAGIGLYIGINKYGFDLEAKAGQDLHIMTQSQGRIHSHINGKQQQIDVFKIEFKNDSKKHATICIPENFGPDIYFKRSAVSTNYTLIWDSQKKEQLEGKSEDLVIRAEQSKELSFQKRGDSYPKLTYYFGNESNKKRYVTLTLL